MVTVGFNTLCYDAERRGIKPSVRISTDSLNYAVAQEIVEQHFTAELQRFLPVDSEYTFAIKSEILLSAENRAGEINVRLPVLTKEQASSSACYPVWFGRIANSPFEILDAMRSYTRLCCSFDH